jgi:hypothetical protein
MRSRSDQDARPLRAGAKSELSGADEANRFLGHFENVEYAEIREAGQMVAAERADMFSATLLDFLERRVPRFAPEYRQGSDARTLRDALGLFCHRCDGRDDTGQGRATGWADGEFFHISFSGSAAPSGLYRQIGQQPGPWKRQKTSR